MALKIAFLTTDNREHEKNYAHATPYFGTAPQALLAGFAELAEVEVHVVSCVRKTVASPKRIASNIFYHSLLVPKIGWMTTGYQGCSRAVRNILRSIQPDIVHGQGTERDCAISAVFSGFPNVITIHGNMRLIAALHNAPPFSFHWLAARLEAFTIPRSQGVVCITRYTQSAVRDLARKTWVVPNAVDQSFFAIRRAPHPEPVILCVGYIAPRKNQNAFIRALDPLAERTTFKVLFLGHASPGDRYGAEFFDLIKTRSWCEHVGFVDRPALKERLATARLLAMPSLEENCPMVVLEAMAADVPVVAGDVGGIPDLIENSATGILFDSTNAESVRAAISSVLKDPHAAEERASVAKQRALQRFHPDVVARQHVQIYREVLNTPR